MAPDKQRVQRYLKAFDFTALFIEELGWDYLNRGGNTHVHEVCSQRASSVSR